MIDKRHAVILALLFLFIAPIALAISYRQETTWTVADITTNTTSCTAVTQIGYGSSKSLGTFTYTNATARDAGINYTLEASFRYGTTSAVTSNTTYAKVTSIDATAYTAKYVGACFRTAGVNGSVPVDINSVRLSWAGGGSIDDDTMEGLPRMGSDTGNFLKNLAPGIGAFIIILGVFVGIGAIIYAIVGVVKSKTMV